MDEELVAPEFERQAMERRRKKAEKIQRAARARKAARLESAKHLSSTDLIRELGERPKSARPEATMRPVLSGSGHRYQIPVAWAPSASVMMFVLLLVPGLLLLLATVKAVEARSGVEGLIYGVDGQHGPRLGFEGF